MLAATALLLLGCSADSATAAPGDTTRVEEPQASTQVDTVFYDGFESGSLSLWQDGVDPAKHRVITDAALAASGQRTLRVTVPPGGDGGWLTRFFMPGYDSLFVRLRVRFDPAWTGGIKLLSLRGSRTDNQWSGFGNAGRCPNGTDFFSGNLTLSADRAPGPLLFYAYYPGMPSSGGSCWGDEGRTATYPSPNMAFSKGTWHTVEYWIKLNTPGQANSVQRLWLDGQLWGEWSGIPFRTSSILMLNSVQLNLGATTTTGGSLYFDDILVTRQRLR